MSDAAAAPRGADPAELLRHLTTTGLAGAVATGPGNTLDKCRRLSSGDPRYTFGLFSAEPPSFAESVTAIADMCGDPSGHLADAVASNSAVAPAGKQDDLGPPGWIDPNSTLAGIEVHRRALAETAARRGRVLLATGHPTGLLGHYGALARALSAAGCTILRPCDDEPLPDGFEPDVVRVQPRMRFVDGVACVRASGDLVHTHRPDGMQFLLDALGDGHGRSSPAAVDLVVADHGLAGAAIARGIATISIADVNDPGLPVAQRRGLTDAVLVIDDNLAPRLFEPVTAAMLAW